MVYLICGGSCAGKSTFSELLSKQLNIEIYHVDEHIDGDHAEQFNKIDHPNNYRILNEGINWLFDLSKDDYVLSNIQLANEDLEFVKKDIDQMNEDIIIDGIWAEPELVNSYFPNSKSIWLFPTQDHQQNEWNSREWTQYVLSEHKNPDLALKNWINGDYETSNYLEKRVDKIQDTKYILNNNISVEENFINILELMNIECEIMGAVEQRFEPDLSSS